MGRRAFFRELLALSVGCGRGKDLDPLFIMMNLNFPWCIMCANKHWLNFLLPLLWVACPTTFAIISKYPWDYWKNVAIRDHHAFSATGHLGLLWGLLAAEVFVRSEVKRSQKLSGLSARTRLWEAEESLSCDAEHLRSGRGRKGMFPKLNKATWAGHPGFGMLGMGESILRGISCAAFLGCAWVARALLSQF